MKRFSFSGLLIVTLVTFLSSCSGSSPGTTSNNGSGGENVAVNNGSGGENVAVDNESGGENVVLDKDSPLFEKFWRYDPDHKKGEVNHYLISIDNVKMLVLVCPYRMSEEEDASLVKFFPQEGSYQARFEYSTDHLDFIDTNGTPNKITFDFSQPDTVENPNVKWYPQNSNEFIVLSSQEKPEFIDFIPLCEKKIKEGEEKIKEGVN